MKLGKKTGVLKGMYFVKNGVRFQIISTLSTGKKAFDAVDTVKNLSNEKCSDIKRVNLCDMDVDSVELSQI